MNDLKELEDKTNDLDTLVAGRLREKRLKLIEDESILKTVSGKADYLDKRVSKRLRNRRIMLGMTQHDVGIAVGVSIQQVQKYEKATNRISSGKLFTIAKLLQVPITYFYEQDDNSEVIDNILVEDVNIPSEKEITNLMRAFNRIKSWQSRKKIIELVQAIN